jgi:hypothetical protein
MNNEIIINLQIIKRIFHFFYRIGPTCILNVGFSHEICKTYILPSLLLTSLCGDNCRRKLRGRETVDKIKKGNKR